MVMTTQKKEFSEIQRLIGKRMSDLRKTHKVSQISMAVALRTHQSTISRIEHGKQVIEVSRFILFCTHLGIDPSTALLGVGLEHPKSTINNQGE